ncbi:DDE-type integrase/transposase/recombinase [Celeribacter sp.]|uniref:DDE-type integrase/transposase/recombinase n=1 Tax=Celeribacter sp. TaxID=1890673 RepID=UPI003A9013A2
MTKDAPHREATQFEIFPDRLHLRRSDPTRNLHRFYLMTVQRDLFGGATLVREWGRTGSRGKLRVEHLRDEGEAVDALADIAKIKRKRGYLYRAVDRDGRTLDFMLSAKRDKAAARRFFKRAISTNGTPDRVAIDKSGANLAGLQAVNVIRKFTVSGRLIRIMQSKYLNNMVEQDHRFIKRITRPTLGFKAFHSAAATLAGIETAHMIRKGQIAANGKTGFQQFASLAA